MGDFLIEESKFVPKILKSSMQIKRWYTLFLALFLRTFYKQNHSLV